MLEIIAVQTKEEQKKLCDNCKIEYREEAFCYSASVDGIIVGVAQFSIKGKNGILFDLEKMPGTDDDDAMFIMGRGLLNFLDLSGVHDVYLEDNTKIEKKLYNRVGFFPDDKGKLYMNLRGFFTPKH